MRILTALITAVLFLPILSWGQTTLNGFPVYQQNQQLTNTNINKIIKSLEQAKKKAEKTAPSPKGVENFYKVSDTLYRGAKPTEEGYKELAKMGIKTVVNLRVTPPNAKLIKELGLKSVHIPINPFLFNDSHAKEFLAIMANPKNHPVYVHCFYGSDRTGTMVALYRIYFEGWTKKSAIKEMLKKEYKFSMVFSNLIDYIRGVKLPKRYRPEDRIPVLRQGR